MSIEQTQEPSNSALSEDRLNIGRSQDPYAMNNYVQENRHNMIYPSNYVTTNYGSNSNVLLEIGQTTQNNSCNYTTSGNTAPSTTTSAHLARDYCANPNESAALKNLLSGWKLDDLFGYFESK